MFSNAVKILSLSGFDIKVDPSWVFIAALVTWSLSQTYFPQVLPGLSGGAYLVMALIGMFGLFASLLLHELGHSVVARHFGVRIKGITLFIFGGVAELKSEFPTAMSEFWVALAGPLVSFCLAFVFWVLAQAAVLVAGGPVGEILSYLALVNLVLALFNLMPAFPLDGGRMLHAVLWYRGGDLLAASHAVSRTSTFFAFALITLGVLAMGQGAVVAGLWQVLIGFFVLIAARSSYTAQLAKTAFEDVTTDALMTREPITVSPELTLSEFVNRIMLRSGVSFVPVVEDGTLLGHIDPSILYGIDRENWSNTRISDVFVGLEPDTMIPPDLPIRDLLEIIAETGRRKFMVVSDHRLLGIVTLADLTRYLRSNHPAHPPRSKARHQ